MDCSGPITPMPVEAVRLTRDNRMLRSDQQFVASAAWQNGPPVMPAPNPGTCEYDCDTAKALCRYKLGLKLWTAYWITQLGTSNPLAL